MIYLAAIGGFGNMLSPAAIHLNFSESPARFSSVFDRGTNSDSHDIKRKQWVSHGAKLVKSFDQLLEKNLDGIVICSGKNGDDLEIIAKLVAVIERQKMPKKPFLVHLSTVSCEFVVAAHSFCKAKKIDYVNYPLTGGVTGAKKASMLILASGDSQIYDKLSPTLALMGKPKYFGARETAGAEVKLIGHTLVFHGLMGITNALNLRTKCFDENIGTEEQVAFFDFLNTGAGGTHQWDLAVKLGVKDQLWQQGFLIKHAVIDLIYTAQLILQKNSPPFMIMPFLQLALIFSFILNHHPQENFATQVIIKIILEESEKLSEFVARYQALDINTYLENCIHSLPEHIQKTVLLDVSVKDFEQVYNHAMG